MTHTDKKLHEGPNPLAVSGDQLDQSRDSDERKEAGYNLKSMFKEVRPLPEGANGVAANMGKPKKSVTIFSLRRGSDPVGLKVKEGPGVVRFSFQKPPVVLEEPLPDPEQNQRPAVRTGSPSVQRKKGEHDSSSGPWEGSKTLTDPPTCLPVSPETNVNAENETLKTEEAPLQTSTPIGSMLASIPGSTSMLLQTCSDPCLSPDQEAGCRFGPPIISLGSSPQMSLQNKTMSSVSSLKSLTSSMGESPSPKSMSRSMASETPDQSRSLTGPPHPALNLNHVTTSATNQDPGSVSVKEQNAETLTTLKLDGKTEIKRAGILKTAKLSPDAFKGSGLSSPSDPGLKSLPLFPGIPLSPSSPKVSRISSVAIVKASPNSKREFSVITLLDEEEHSSSSKDQQKEPTGGPEEPHPATSLQGDLPPTAAKECSLTLEPRARAALGPERDDLMEMEDIKDCKVTHVGGAKRMEERGDELKLNQQVRSLEDEEKMEQEHGHRGSF